MPYFSIETNKSIDEFATKEIMKKSSTFISGLLGKSEQYIMVSIKTKIPLIFAGIEGPAAFVQLKSIGLPTAHCGKYSEKICEYIQEELGIPSDRIFIDFTNLDGNMFGWNGKTF